MSYANAPREKLAIALELINLRLLPACGYAIATDFLRLGPLGSNFFFSPTSDECYTYYKANAEFQLEIPWKRGAEITQLKKNSEVRIKTNTLGLRLKTKTGVGWVEERSKIPKGNPTLSRLCWVTLKLNPTYYSS